MRTLTVTFDVTDLEPDEVDALEMELAVQGERSDGHPSVPLVAATRED